MEFKDNREKLHRAIRESNFDDIKDILSQTDGAKLAKSKNYFGKMRCEAWSDCEYKINYSFRIGRCAAHIAVLKENEEIVEYIASRYKQSFRVGDNVSFLPFLFTQLCVAHTTMMNGMKTWCFKISI